MAKKRMQMTQKSLRIEEIFPRFVNAQMAKGVSEKTVQTYHRHFRCLGYHLDMTMTFDELTKETLESMLVSLRKSGVSPNTVSSYARATVRAVHTSDVHNLRGSDAHAATGASILAAAALSGSDAAKSRNAVVSASASDLEAAELVSIDKNVAQLVLQNHFQKLVARTGDRPTILVMVIDNQAMGEGCIPELAVVVGVASAAILNALHIIVVVNHFVQQRYGNLFDGSGEGSCSDVDFMSAANLGDPSVLSQGEVSIGFGGRLNGDGGS